MKDIEQIIKEVSGTMAMEGVDLREEDKERIRVCLSNEISLILQRVKNSKSDDWIFGKVAGYTIDFSNISDIEMISASVEAFNYDYDKMTEIFRKITKPITKEEQEDFIKEIATKNSPVIKAYNIVTVNKPLG